MSSHSSLNASLDSKKKDINTPLLNMDMSLDLSIINKSKTFNTSVMEKRDLHISTEALNPPMH